MDPLTHALTGAAIAATLGRDRKSLLIGAAAGLAPDLDIFIRSTADPLLAIEHHRGFTHALLFAPVGGTIVALLLRRPGAILAATLAWLSHSLLDASTTYGTQLFWPFSRHRVGLDIISIVDPAFTLIVLAAAVAAYRQRYRPATFALVIATLWLVIGAAQRERAMDVQEKIARSRGDTRWRGEVFPTVGNTLVWRSIYESGGTLRLDRIRVPWFGAGSATPVTTVPHITAIEANARGQRDFARLAWFSNGWIAASPTDPTLLGDARYSLRSDGYEPVWGIRFAGGRTEWVDRSRQRRLSR